MIAAICSCHGIWEWATRDYSFNAEAYLDFLRQCKRRWRRREPMIVFQDCSKVHTSKIAKAGYQELGVKAIWNVAYKPEYNCGIERMWAQMKAKFRPVLLGFMLNVKAKDMPLERAVEHVMSNFDQSSLPSFIARA